MTKVVAVFGLSGVGKSWIDVDKPDARFLGREGCIGADNVRNDAGVGLVEFSSH
jgi:hypothetical protein